MPAEKSRVIQRRDRWRAEIAKRFSHLSQTMVMGLALWSVGMIIVRSCRLTAIAAWWSCRLGQPLQTVRERLAMALLLSCFTCGLQPARLHDTDFANQPNISRPVAAIQLPATRTAIRGQPAGNAVTSADRMAVRKKIALTAPPSASPPTPT